MHLESFLLPLRIVQGIFAVIVFALCAYIASWFNDHTIINASPSEVNFLIFAGIFTLVITLPVIFLAPRFLPSATPKFALLGVEALTMIFWFAGFIALAAGLGAISGMWCGGKVCDSMKAAAAFGAFEWLAFVGSIVIVALGTFRGKGNAPVTPHSGV